MGTNWLLIRHGRTEANRRRLLSGQDNQGLDYEGRWQMIRAGSNLRGSPPPPLLLHSDQPRARQSAAALAVAAGWPTPNGGAWTSSPALRERDLGLWQGRDYDALRASGESRELIGWRRAPPQGESLADLAHRSLRVLAQLPDEPGLIVAHAGTIRVLLGLARETPLEDIGVLRLPQASPIGISLPTGGWRTVLDGLSASLRAPA
jgi:broad specificity phosphatase PhoE